jgi:RNA polymerase sigma-70 factor (ECF subfamily)
VPENPAAWIVTAARNRAIDRIRRERRWAGRRAALEAELRALGGGEDEDDEPVSPIPDERLRLIFTTCHPALEPEARVALTLRVLGGLTTSEGRARPWSARRRWRMDRARQAQDRHDRHPVRVPRDADLPRLRSCWPPVSDLQRRPRAAGRPGLVAGRRLGRVLAALMPDEPEALALLADASAGLAPRRAR